MLSVVGCLTAVAVAGALAAFRVSSLAWLAFFAAVAWACTSSFDVPFSFVLIAWVMLFGACLVLGPTPLRRAVLTGPLLKAYRRLLPRISRTEREALEAGTVWWDGELFGGRPDWSRLQSVPAPNFTAEEQAFLDGPVHELCGMLDDWDIMHVRHDLPGRVWDFMRRAGFFGMIIPKEYGGKAFSALAHSEVVMRITTRSGAAAVTVMVPNSLGPAELLLHYGTESQKRHYLPRLAEGTDIPCFALTAPDAGSDAAGIPDYGIVCRETWRGEPGTLGVRLFWEKRYITLAPVATVLGLAFRLRDPDHLLGPETEPGITLALIPVDTPGVHIGRRHRPMNAAFMNGPTWGDGVFIPLEWVIGGREGVGRGWPMLMNCLAAGRSISLPANAVGIAKLCAQTGGAYGRVRRQFGIAIGRFEGVEAALARIGCNLYLMDAARTLAARAVDLGEKPSVVSAIVKYALTERARHVVNDVMDIHGGKGICMGPSNYLASAYMQIPIAITVEGANILTRSLIIFGQGVIRAHPYVLREIEAAAAANDDAETVITFDRALSGHCSFFLSNVVRALWHGITGGRFVRAPGSGRLRRYRQHVTRLSTAFALVTDAAMVLFGGALKQREGLSGRLADVLSHLFLASAVTKRFEDDGCPEADLPLLIWTMEDTLARTEEAFRAFFDNLPYRIAARVLEFAVFPGAFASRRAYRAPGDRLTHQVVQLLLNPCQSRERLTRGVYISANANDPVAVLEAAMEATIAAEPCEDTLHAARRSGRLSPSDSTEEAVKRGIISDHERSLIERSGSLRRRAIMVDDFPRDLGSTEIHQTTRPVAQTRIDAR